MVERGFPAMEDHAELGAPIADVVVGDDFEAEKTRDAAKRIADDRRADVANVHGFSDVRSGEIDDDCFPFAGFRSAEPQVAQQALSVGGIGFGEDRDIYKTRAVDLRGGESSDLHSCQNLFGESARIRLLFFRKHHRGVALIIAETKIRSRGYVGGGRLTEDGFQRAGEPGFEVLKKSHGD